MQGEVEHPATYGIQPGERLSSLLMRCNGFTAEAFPYGAVLLRQEVRELEMKSHEELVSRLKSEQGYLKALPENDADQKTAKLTAIAQTDTALQQLEAIAPVGRVVIHIPSNLNKLAKTPADVALRDGDVLIIPKKTNYVVVSGQVFNPTAVSYLPGRSAKWYLGQSGGLTQVADKKAVFVVRADGSVLSAKNNSGFWMGDPLNAVLRPGRLHCRAREGGQGCSSQLDCAFAGCTSCVVRCTHRCLYPSIEPGLWFADNNKISGSFSDHWDGSFARTQSVVARRGRSHFDGYVSDQDGSGGSIRRGNIYRDEHPRCPFR